MKITIPVIRDGDAEVQILDGQTLPEKGIDMWDAGTLGKDECIYYMPYNARHILKLDPNDDDSHSSVGKDLGGEGGSTEEQLPGMMV